MSASGVVWFSKHLRCMVSPCIDIWLIVLVIHCETQAHINRAERLLKAHCLPLDASIEWQSPWWILPLTIKLAFDIKKKFNLLCFHRKNNCKNQYKTTSATLTTTSPIVLHSLLPTFVLHVPVHRIIYNSPGQKSSLELAIHVPKPTRPVKISVAARSQQLTEQHKLLVTYIIPWLLLTFEYNSKIPWHSMTAENISGIP